MKTTNAKAGIFLTILLMTGLVVAGCSSAQPTPAVVTVMQTVQVEVTRLVEVTVPVEVTREVVVTQLVEVVVTPSAETTSLPTDQVSGYQPTQGGYLGGPTPTVAFTPQAKGEGYAPVIVHSFAKERMELYLRGPVEISLALNPGNQQRIWLPMGNYTYFVYDPTGLAYDGTFKIASFDKYDLNIYDKKMVVRVP